MNWLRGAWTAALLAAAGGAAWAQDAGSVRPQRDLLTDLLNTLVFSLLGIALAILGFKLFDMVIRHDVEREICEKNNVAAAILAGSIILGICLIVGMVVNS
jgi:hypothetical protein